MSLSPSPPPLPSPQLLPTPLLSRPSPLLENTLDHTRSNDVLHRPSTSPRFPDDTSRAEHRRPIYSRTPKRTQSSCRYRSPPPSPAIRSPPPPVPPIPAFVLATNHSPTPSIQNHTPAFDLYLDRPTDTPFCESQANGALTCMQFLAVHNSRRQCRV